MEEVVPGVSVLHNFVTIYLLRENVTIGWPQDEHLV